MPVLNHWGTRHSVVRARRQVYLSLLHVQGGLLKARRRPARGVWPRRRLPRYPVLRRLYRREERARSAYDRAAH
eukprot:4470052-Prymnesium_polylepis.3